MKCFTTNFHRQRLVRHARIPGTQHHEFVLVFHNKKLTPLEISLSIYLGSFPGRWLTHCKKWPLYCPQGSGTLRQQLLMIHGIAWYCRVLHCIAWYFLSLIIFPILGYCRECWAFLATSQQANRNVNNIDYLEMC